jgi:hypothetical protein
VVHVLWPATKIFLATGSSPNPFIDHWNGKAWAQVSVPIPPPAAG